jgi:hypothetical protein
MPSAEALIEMQTICPGAAAMSEAGLEYIFLPGLKLPPGRTPAACDALLCLSGREGYTTRLFLSVQLSDRGSNWNTFRILDRVWYSWSWNHVPASGRPMQILAEHLSALR